MKLRSRRGDAQTMKLLLERGEALALARGEQRPGAEHLVLSALELPDGTARRAFERAGADPDAYGAAIAAAHADALRAVGIEPVPDEALGDVPPARPGRIFRATPAVGEALRAAHAMVRDGDQQTGLLGAHVVAAVARTQHGTAVRALRAMDVDPAALAAAAEAEVAALAG